MSEIQIEQYECSICLEAIESNINKVITECGHAFHCSCIMTNIIHNGFNCPNCRAKMAEEPSDEETEDDNSRPWSGTDDMSFFEDEDREIYEDDMLRGFRMFNNRINGEEHEYEDIGDEYVYQNYVLNEVTRNAGINEVTTNEVVVNAINEVVVNLEDEVVISKVRFRPTAILRPVSKGTIITRSSPPPIILPFFSNAPITLSFIPETIISEPIGICLSYS